MHAADARRTVGAVMLRADSTIDFAKTRWSLGGLLFGRWALARGRTVYKPRWRSGRMAALLAAQLHRPLAVLELDRRLLWVYRDRFYWDDECLGERDVEALVADRERRSRRRLERAHALLAAESGGAESAAAGREGIVLEVKRRVWERCSGRCVECGSDRLLEFDHVIPLALGGSNGERNLQLLCAECNRTKGDGL